MTWEEAIERLERLKRSCHDLAVGMPEEPGWILREMALNMALSALRPVSREKVAKVWRGEWHRHYKSGIHAGNGVVCSKCDMWNNRAAHFCPACGALMTDEAVDMVMERMEEMK